MAPLLFLTKIRAKEREREKVCNQRTRSVARVQRARMDFDFTLIRFPLSSFRPFPSLFPSLILKIGISAKGVVLARELKLYGLEVERHKQKRLIYESLALMIESSRATSEKAN